MDAKTNGKNYERKSSLILETAKSEFLELGQYLLKKLKSPFTVVGLGYILVLIIIAAFPQILTPYSFSEAVGVYPDAWAPPSTDHPLGQTKFGRDVLARVVFGLADSLLFGTVAVLICVVAATIIGVSLNFLNKRLNLSAEMILFPMFMIPLILLFSFTFSIFVPNNLNSGLYFTPFFAYLIAKERFSISSIAKKVIAYIPLLLGLIILAYNFLGYLGFYNYASIQLGGDISNARQYLYIAPWAVFFPGLAIIALLLGFFILYMGLQKSPNELNERF